MYYYVGTFFYNSFSYSPFYSFKNKHLIQIVIFYIYIYQSSELKGPFKYADKFDEIFNSAKYQKCLKAKLKDTEQWIITNMRLPIKVHGWTYIAGGSNEGS